MDLSIELYKRYFSNSDRLIEISLKNGRILKGYFIAFIPGNSWKGESYIAKWRFIPVETENVLMAGLFDIPTGELVDHKDILKVKLSDGSIIGF